MDFHGFSTDNYRCFTVKNSYSLQNKRWTPVIHGFFNHPWIRVIHGFSRLFMVFHGYSPLFMDFHRFSWIFTDYHGFPWIFTDYHGFPWIFMVIHRYSWISANFHGFSLIIMDFQPSEPSVQWKELMFPCQKEAIDSVDLVLSWFLCCFRQICQPLSGILNSSIE